MMGADMELHTLLAAAVIGLLIGFLGGLLGKGGSAIATPLLHAVGVPAIIAVAAPLPATIPSTLAASWVYWKDRYLDTGIVRTCVLWGVPATVAGALATRWINGGLLVELTDVVLVGIGIRLLVRTGVRRADATAGTSAPAEHPSSTSRAAARWRWPPGRRPTSPPRRARGCSPSSP